MTKTFFPTTRPSSAAVPVLDTRAIRAFHQSLPGYAVTPLYSCPLLAERLGVARVLVKDESKRLGLPSFKMLGASWATATAISREWLGFAANPESIAQLKRDLASTFGRTWRVGRRLVAATDGNHGRGVARMARLLRLRCQIFVPAGTAKSRIRSIEREGARVDVVNGTYDDAIARSAEEASATTLVVSDTSWDGYTETPTNVINGYSTMFSEIDDQMGLAQPNVVAFQAGVGAFAAAGMMHWANRRKPSDVTMLAIEPSTANCLMESARAGAITLVPGPHESTMAGLNCGLPSLLAWPIVEEFTDGYIAVTDDSTFAAMRLLAECGIVAGESGAAGLAGLLAVSDPDQRRHTGLTSGATVLVINTEGATDPLNYRRVTAETAKGVMRTQRRRQNRTHTITVNS
jgi:diaminopropionate ammonia-lyase